MSQTLDCEFVGKHFTTLCLHRAVGDPTSHYSALWSPEQIWRGWQERERETECIFDSEAWGKIRKRCFGILKLDHQLYSFSYLGMRKEWERNEKGLQSLEETENLWYLDMAVCKRKVAERHDAHNDLCKWHQFLSQQLLWFSLILPVAFVNSSPAPLKLWGWFRWSSLLGYPSSGSDQREALLSLITSLDLRRSRGWGWPKRCAMFSKFEEQA